MRERIIDVAIDLFARQGYQGTSLRQIAERLDITKAAVYHHFHAKEDIARVVVSRTLDTLAEMFDRLIVAGTDPAAWQRALPQIIDIALAHRQPLFMLERNEDVFHTMFADDPELGARLAEREATGTALFADPRIDPAVRVRLGCTVGAVFGPLTDYIDFYEDIPAQELRHYLNDAIVLLLQDLPSDVKARSGARPGGPDLAPASGPARRGA